MSEAPDTPILESDLVMLTSAYTLEPVGAPHVVVRPPFEVVYDEHADFVWRSLRRLGVSERSADDLLQEVFLVVHRRLAEWEGRSTLKTWIFGIALGIVRNHRRANRRQQAVLVDDEPTEGQGAHRPSEKGPHASAVKSEAVRILYALLDELDEEKRTVFVLAELEELTVPEIAGALELNVNTVYSRLRAARQDFEQALSRHRAKSNNGRSR